VRTLFRLVAPCSVAAAVALAAMPWLAAAAVETETNFNVTVNGPSPSGATLRLFLATPPGKGQDLLFCAPHAPLRLQGPILPCQGGGKTYDIGLSAPAGTKGSYRFELVAADGAITILRQGTLTARYDGPLASQEQTFNVTYNVPTMPNTATAARAVDESGPLLLGILTLLAATLLAGSARRRHGLPSAAPSRRCSPFDREVQPTAPAKEQTMTTNGTRRFAGKVAVVTGAGNGIGHAKAPASSPRTCPRITAATPSGPSSSSAGT
jgi:hypothetical protein